jgi:hypothetical protein
VAKEMPSVDVLGAVRGILTAAALAAPILAGANTPSGFWASHHEILFVSVVAGVAAAGWDPILRELGQGGRRRRVRCEHYSRLFMNALLVSLVEATGTDWKDTGVYVYRVRWGRIPILRSLTRICELRMRALEQDMVGVRWRFRRGVVGKCWAEERSIIEDWVSVSAQLKTEVERISNAKSISAKKAWRKIRKDTRWGLTYRQFCDSEVYQRIAGYPVKDVRGRVIGVLSIDGPIDKDRLGATDVKQFILGATLGVAGHL